MILRYVDKQCLFRKIYFLNKAGLKLAMDCSILKEIVYGKEHEGYSYDCEDYLECFLGRLGRGEELRKLDFHYYFRGDELAPGILKKLARFPNLQDLRFG